MNKLESIGEQNLRAKKKKLNNESILIYDTVNMFLSIVKCPLVLVFSITIIIYLTCNLQRVRYFFQPKKGIYKLFQCIFFIKKISIINQKLKHVFK